MRKSKNKQQTELGWLKPSYFLVIAIIFVGLSVLTLRANNMHMLALRSDVYAADKDNTDVQAALQSLQAYVTTHMNTNLSSGPNAVHPPIQLQYSYERAKSQISTQNNQIYTDAQHFCEKQNPTGFYGATRLDCIKQYLSSHSLAVSTVPDSLYKFDFASPSWSPDLAGWSIVLAILNGILFPASWVLKKLVN